MNCPRCGKPLPAGASFCMHCGQMVAATVPGPSYVQSATIPADVRRRNTLLAIAISAALLLFLFFGLKVSGLLPFGSRGTDQAALQARGQGTDIEALAAKGSAPDDALLQARGTAPTPTLEAAKKTMPKDIHDWLEHLARIEKRKQALGGKQMEQMLLLKSTLTGAGGLSSADDVTKLTDPDYNSFPSIEKAGSMIAELQPDWVALRTDFEAVPPPPECKPIAEEYSGALTNIVDTFDSVSKILDNVTLTDQNKIKDSADQAKAVGRNHRRGIDGNFERADDLVQGVCDKYQTRKWFKIDAHGGSSGLLGF